MKQCLGARPIDKTLKWDREEKVFYNNLGEVVKDPEMKLCTSWTTYRFAICTKCEAVYGRSSLEWPLWLRESWILEQRDRRRHKRQAEFEMSYPEDELEFMVGR